MTERKTLALDTNFEYTYHRKVNPLRWKCWKVRMLCLRHCLFSVALLFLGSLPVKAAELEVDSFYDLFVVEIDRRPSKDAVYSKCVAMFTNKSVDVSFLSAATPVADRECPGKDSLKFTYTTDQRGEHITGEKGRIVAETSFPTDHDSAVRYKGKIWTFAVLPNMIRVNVPSHSESKKEVQDSFCLASICTKVINEKDMEFTMIACDDCSSLQKCVDTELPMKKPLRIGGKEVETTPHNKKESDRTRSH